MTEYPQDQPSYGQQPGGSIPPYGQQPGGRIPPYGQQPGGPMPPYGQQTPQDYPGGQPGPPMGGPGPAYGYQAQPPVSPSDARMLSLFAHLGGTFLSFLVPLVIYLMYKDRDPFIRRHAAQALNFHITLFIVYAISAVLFVVIIGIFTFLAAWICALVFTIMAAVAANDGREYTYPMAITFVS